MEKLKSRLYIAVLIFVAISVCLTLLSTGRQRDFYYIAIYLGFVGLILERKELVFKKFSIAYPIIFFGFVKIIWFFGLEHSPEGYNFYSDQFSGGKKLLLGGVLAFYLTQCRHYLNHVNYEKILIIVVGIAFTASSCYAIWQAMHGMDRVEMGMDRATNSAYIYSTFSIFFVYLLYTLKKPTFYIIAALVIIASFIVVILTGTRAAIIFHLLIMACMSFYHFKKLHLKSILLVVLISSIASIALYKNYIEPKIMQTYDEVNLYQEGQDNTSLGARFSLWTVGLKNFANAPLGQSFKSRYDFTEQYVKDNPQFKSSMELISVHLHNEMVETLSLQGIFGGLSLLWLYMGIAWAAFRQRNTPLLFTMNCMVVYGLGDVLLLSSEAILFFISLIGICGAISLEKEKTN